MYRDFSNEKQKYLFKTATFQPIVPQKFFDTPSRKQLNNEFVSLWKNVGILKTKAIRELEIALTRYDVEKLYKPWSCHLNLMYLYPLFFTTPLNVAAATGNVALFKVIH